MRVVHQGSVYMSIAYISCKEYEPWNPITIKKTSLLINQIHRIYHPIICSTRETPVKTGWLNPSSLFKVCLQH